MVSDVSAKWATIISVVVGGALSLLASTLIQTFASLEQTQLVRDLTVDATGILPLPDAFHRMKWIAYATKRAGSDGQKIIEWRIAPLIKVGGTGARFVSYALKAPNLVGEQVGYSCTFVGLQSCVLATITIENEMSSTITFDTAVPDAGVFFGPAYLTDWGAGRDLTLAMIGTGDQPQLDAFASAIINAFESWFEKKVDWSVVAAFAAHPSRNNNKAPATVFKKQG